jgi:hypothetical protein
MESTPPLIQIQHSPYDRPSRRSDHELCAPVIIQSQQSSTLHLEKPYKFPPILLQTTAQSATHKMVPAKITVPTSFHFPWYANVAIAAVMLKSRTPRSGPITATASFSDRGSDAVTSAVGLGAVGVGEGARVEEGRLKNSAEARWG